MTLGYLDTSAAMKLLVDERESEALVAQLVGVADRRLVASWLLHAELYCAAGRHPAALDIGSIAQVLDTVYLVDVMRGDMIAAGGHAPLRTSDAIHLAVAVRVGADEMITYDRELADASARLGLAVVSPE